MWRHWPKLIHDFVDSFVTNALLSLDRTSSQEVDGRSDAASRGESLRGTDAAGRTRHFDDRSSAGRRRSYASRKDRRARPTATRDRRARRRGRAHRDRHGRRGDERGLAAAGPQLPGLRRGQGSGKPAPRARHDRVHQPTGRPAERQPAAGDERDPCRSEDGERRARRHPRASAPAERVLRRRGGGRRGALRPAVREQQEREGRPLRVPRQRQPVALRDTPGHEAGDRRRHGDRGRPDGAERLLPERQPDERARAVRHVHTAVPAEREDRGDRLSEPARRRHRGVRAAEGHAAGRAPGDDDRDPAARHRPARRGDPGELCGHDHPGARLHRVRAVRSGARPDPLLEARSCRRRSARPYHGRRTRAATSRSGRTASPRPSSTCPARSRGSS